MGPGALGSRIMEVCDQKPGSEHHSISDALGTGAMWFLRLPEGGRDGSHLNSTRSHTGPEIQENELHVGPERPEVRVME